MVGGRPRDGDDLTQVKERESGATRPSRFSITSFALGRLTFDPIDGLQGNFTTLKWRPRFAFFGLRRVVLSRSDLDLDDFSWI